VRAAALALLLLAGGCGIVRDPSSTASWYGPTLTPISDTSRDLMQLPLPRGKIVASVYGFRDQTGQ
jgi:curli production assembly/transport component CsgG